MGGQPMIAVAIVDRTAIRAIRMDTKTDDQHTCNNAILAITLFIFR
jgi:hypothetical protein